MGRPGGKKKPPTLAAARVAAPRGGAFALGRPGGKKPQAPRRAGVFLRVRLPTAATRRPGTGAGPVRPTCRR
ncbi:hypothetical protein AL509_29665 [Achromobacter xylosoxidans]|nr:hypothetical protein AL509_29665 [Achromobacter xylosoxidans]